MAHPVLVRFAKVNLVIGAPMELQPEMVRRSGNDLICLKNQTLPHLYAVKDKIENRLRNLARRMTIELIWRKKLGCAIRTVTLIYWRGWLIFVWFCFGNLRRWIDSAFVIPLQCFLLFCNDEPIWGLGTLDLANIFWLIVEWAVIIVESVLLVFIPVKKVCGLKTSSDRMITSVKLSAGKIEFRAIDK